MEERIIHRPRGPAKARFGTREQHPAPSRCGGPRLPVQWRESPPTSSELPQRMPPDILTAEEQRLADASTGKAAWRRWGPYLSERQWGTVREDYSANGTAWEYLPHDHARSRAYRWGEDGIAGICDDRQTLCFALALWNGADPILKERLFGLTGNEGNHGEDVKEYYFYLDNVPSHAYMKCLYKYPQRAFPYADLVAENRRRGRRDPEYELIDTGIFADDRYFDVFVEYAKAAPDDIMILVRAVNHGPEVATLHLLPTLWFKNDWSWVPGRARPQIVIAKSDPIGTRARGGESRDRAAIGSIAIRRTTSCSRKTNRTWRGCSVSPNASPFVKDAFHAFVVDGRRDAVNPAHTGSKAAPLYVRPVGPGETAVVRLRLCNAGDLGQPLGETFDATFALRKREADDFYQRVTPFALPEDMRNVQRQAFAGMLWSKQYYRFMVHRWLEGDRAGPPPPEERKQGRDHEWWHLAAGDVLSMPDKWEYPWFAAWDMAFHCVAFAMIDPDFAKNQLLLLTREWYMHPNGQIPAYEWAFGDCQSAGARVGRDPRLPDRGQDVRPQGSRVPRADLPEAADQLHVVGQPQGHRGQQHLRGRVPRPRQHRRVRPDVGSALGRPAGAGRRHELDGDVLPQHARPRARTGEARTPSTRMSRRSSSSISSISARQSTGWATAKAASGTKKRATTSTRSSSRTAAASR